MKTRDSAFFSVALLLAMAATVFPKPAQAQNSGGNIIPTVTIRAAVPETREPSCNPAVCDAPLPAPGVFVVTRQGGDLARELAVSMSYAGTATAGTDYPALPSSVIFRPGQGSVELHVEAAYDTSAEGEETVLAQVQPDPSAGPVERYRVNPSESSARVVIRDNETAPKSVVSIEATHRIAEETSEPLRRLPLRGLFTISRTGSTDKSLSVFVHYSGTATQGVDYPNLPWLVTIPAGTNRVSIEVVPNIDNQPEPIETVKATLSKCPPATNPPMGIPCNDVEIDPAQATAQVFIRDNGITTASLEITAPKEGAQFPEGAPIRIAATAIDLEGAITHVDFYDGERKIGESIITFVRQPDPGEPIYHEYEWRGAPVGPHTLTARAADSTGQPVVSPPVHIRVGEGLPFVSIEATVPETTEPSLTSRIAPGIFTLRRTGNTSSSLRVWVHYGGSAKSGSDYTELPTVTEFPAGRASVELSVVALDDNLVEGDENVVAELSNSPASIPPQYRMDPAKNRAVVVIHDNEPPAVPVVSIVATTPSTAEPCPTCLIAPGVFTISRTGPVQNGLLVFIATRGTATPSADYARLPVSVEIPAGKEAIKVLVLPEDDLLVEGDETVIVELQPDSNSNSGSVERYRINAERREATVVIHDNDFASLPLVSIRATRSETQEPVCAPNTCLAPEPAPGVLVVSRQGGDKTRPLAVRLDYGGTALPRLDYVSLPERVEIPAGQDSVELFVSALFDELTEGDETVVAALRSDATGTSPGSYRVDSAQAMAKVTIHDRTPPTTKAVVTIIADDPFAGEGATTSSPLNTATFVVRRIGPTNDALEVLFEIGGTASNGVDYVAIQSPLVIPAGQRSAQIVIKPLDDNKPEPVETVRLSLKESPASNPRYTVGQPRRAAAVIVDNDRSRPPCMRLADGRFNVCVPMDSTHCFRVETSLDVKIWTPVCLLPVRDGVAHYVDPDSSELTHRFYRLIRIPCEHEN